MSSVSALAVCKTSDVKKNDRDVSYESREVLEKVEKLAKQHQRPRGRQLAQELHQQADLLHSKGDYETALILYHRAANVYPRDSSHNIAAKKTSAVISSATNPTGALWKLMQGAKNDASLVPTFCRETAAHQAQTILRESRDPYTDVKKILKYFDCRGDFPDGSGTKGSSEKSMTRSRIMLRQLNEFVDVQLHNMKRSLAAGDWETTLKIGNELLAVTGGLQNHPSHQLAVHRFLALTHLSLGRHDRAVSEVSSMVQAAKASGDVKLLSRSLAVLGKVHLTFGHLDAAARAWERLSVDLNEPTPKAWILHEIGRCYFETSRHSKALEMARRCIEWAEEAHSTKWMCYGRLLTGQALVELGRLAEALKALRFVVQVAEKEMGDAAILHYVQDVITQVSGILQKVVGFQEKSMNDVTSSRKLLSPRYTKEASSKGTADDIEGKSLSARVLLLKKLRDMQETDSISSTARTSTRRVRGPDKGLDENLNKSLHTKDNIKATMKVSNRKSCHIIDKWKSFLSQRKSCSQPQSDLEGSLSSRKTSLTSERTRVLLPAGDAPQVDKRTLGMELSKGSCSTKRHASGSDWKLLLSPESSGMNEDQPEAELTISTGRTYGIASFHPLYRHSLPSTAQSLFNDPEEVNT